MKYIGIILFLITTAVHGSTSLYTVNAQPHLNVRSSASVHSKIVGKVTYGQAVRVRDVVSEIESISGKRGRWVKIQYNTDSFGYVFDAFLKKPSRNTYSFKMYQTGNSEYRAGNYYQAIKYYHLSFENTENEVERIKILGALAQISKVKGNIELAKGYARKILIMDGKNKFSKEILLLRQRPVQVARQRVQPATQNYSTSKTHTCTERTEICLALTWGPDACSASFNKYAARELDSTVHDIIASPSCLVAISETLNEDYSQTDIELAMFTGVLDEMGKAGVNSENFFGKLFGGFSYLYSHAIKYSLYESCMKKCQ